MFHYRNLTPTSMLMNNTGITAMKMTQMAVVIGRYASSSCSSLSPPGDTWNCPLKSYSPVAMATVLSMALAGVENAVRYRKTDGEAKCWHVQIVYINS